MNISSRLVLRPAFSAVLLAAACLAGSPAIAIDVVFYPNGSTNTDRFNLSAIPDNQLILQTASGTATQAGVISGWGTVYKLDPGTLNLTGANTFAGAFHVDDGTIGIGHNSAFGTADIILSGSSGLRAVNAARTINNAIYLNSQSFTVGRLTTFNGNVGVLDPAGVVITANNPDGPANGDTVFNGVISGAGRAVYVQEGANGIGTGSIVFNGTNTYTGGTGIVSGRLTIGATGRLAHASPLEVYGGNIIFNNAAQTLNSLRGSSGGTLTLGSGHTLTLTQSATTTFSGTIAGTGSLILNGPGTLRLEGTNTFTGTTTLQGSTLEIHNPLALQNTTFVPFGGSLMFFTSSATMGGLSGGAGSSILLQRFGLGTGVALTVGGNGMNTTFEGVLEGWGSLVKTGTGTLTLSSGNTFIGGLTVSAGTLRAESNAYALGLGSLRLSGGTLALANNSALEFGRNTTITTDSTILADRTSAGAGVTFTLGTLGIGANTLTVQRGSVATSGIGGVTFGATTLTGNATFSPQADAQLNLGSIAGSGFGLIKTGAGTLTLTAANTYNGGTTVNAGQLTVSSTSSLASGSALTVNGGTLALNNAAQTVGSLSGTGGTISLGTGHVFTVAPSVWTSFGGAIAGSGGVVKSGTGALTLTGASTYTGGTTVNAGQLTIGSTGSLASGFAMTVNGGTLALNNAAQTVGSLSGADGAISLGTGHVFTIASSPTTGFGGVVSGSGALLKSGSGMLTLTGVNTYTGGTTLIAGSLQVGHDSALGTGAIVLSGGGLQGNGATRTLANSVLLTAASTIGGSSDLVFNGNFANSRANVGINFTNTGATVFNGTFALSTTATNSSFNVDAHGGTVTINGPITNGTGGSTGSGIIKRGSGALEFGGVNTYGGSTTVTDGILRLVGAGALPGGSLIVTAGYPGANAVFDLNGRTVTPSFVRLGGANTADTVSVSSIVDTAGGGRLTLGGDVSFTATGNPLGSTISAALDLGGASRTMNIENSTSADHDLTISGVISGNPGLGVTKTGAGALLLTGSNTYTGLTRVSNGTLALGGSGSIAGDLGVASGATFDTTALAGYRVGAGRTVTVSGTLNAGAGKMVTVDGALKGSGDILGEITIAAGGTISPGDSPGILNTGSETWLGGGAYEWELNSATGAAGTNWDFLNIDGVLLLSGLDAEDPFTIAIRSLDGANTPGAADNFDPLESYSWTLSSASGGISGFDTDHFFIDTSGFANAPGSAGFSIAAIGNDLVLTYAAVPEPATCTLALASFAGMVLLGRRRRPSRK